MKPKALITDYPMEAFEKKNVHERPAIPFHPDYDRDDIGRTMKIKVNASAISKAKGENTVELEMELFETGIARQPTLIAPADNLRRSLLTITTIDQRT